jgi:hypothetical protein
MAGQAWLGNPRLSWERVRVSIRAGATARRAERRLAPFQSSERPVELGDLPFQFGDRKRPDLVGWTLRALVGRNLIGLDDLDCDLVSNAGRRGGPDLPNGRGWIGSHDLEVNAVRCAACPRKTGDGRREPCAGFNTRGEQDLAVHADLERFHR